MYKLTNSTGVLRLSDGAFIPADPDNADYAAYVVWVGEGNTPLPAISLTREQEKDIEIAHILATQGKGKDRLLIQAVIQLTELAAPGLAAQHGVSLEVALATLYARLKSYRECKDAEAACRAVETGP